MAETSIEQLRELVDVVRSLPRGCDDSESIDRLRLLEELKAAASAVQLQTAVDFESSVRAAQQRAHDEQDTGPDGSRVPPKVGRGIAGQVALALRHSPASTVTWLARARMLCRDLPGTFVALKSGVTTEQRALLVAKELTVLSRADRFRADAELAPLLGAWGTKKTEAEARKACYRLDPHAALNRAVQAQSDRRVSTRPAPDAMCWLTALLPLTQAVATQATLDRAAASARAAGDPRTRGQVMADTLVERVTGQATAEDVPVEIQLVMSTDTLLANDDDADGDDAAARAEPASIPGYGPIPGLLARQLALRPGAPRWLRRLFTAPVTGRLVQAETHRRLFTEAQRGMLNLRDDTCRTPYCDAPIRHADHLQPHEQGGATSLDNAQGLCEACNHTKQTDGWTVTAARDGTITTRTPTGHTDDSPVPIPLGRPVAPGTRDHTRRHLQRLAAHADTPAERTAADLIYRGLFDYAAA